MGNEENVFLVASFVHLTGLSAFDGSAKVDIWQDDNKRKAIVSDPKKQITAVSIPYDRILGVFATQGAHILSNSETILGETLSPPMDEGDTYFIIRYATKDGVIRAAVFKPASWMQDLDAFANELRRKCANGARVESDAEAPNSFVAQQFEPIQSSVKTPKVAPYAPWICPRCNGSNILIQSVTEVSTKHRGCLGWALWILLAFLTFGLILIIPALTNSKVKSKNRSEAVCQSCGNRWRV